MSNPQKPKRPAPVIVPRKIAEWAREKSAIGQVNNYKVGGGRPTWNGRR